MNNNNINNLKTSLNSYENKKKEKAYMEKILSKFQTMKIPILTFQDLELMFMTF